MASIGGERREFQVAPSLHVSAHRFRSARVGCCASAYGGSTWQRLLVRYWCYDLRFPELFCSLANSCEVLVTIANWPQRRVGHWRTLLQARAIENQVLMIGVNRTGIDGNGLAYERSSLVFDANGTALEPIRSEGEIDLHRIDLEALRRFRAGFPTRPDRRSCATGSRAAIEGIP